jgi:hypothetical protein
MKPSSPGRPAAPLSRAHARNCALLNQLATPGLGSLMAGRWFAGAGQLLLALAGFGMITAWFTLLALQFYRELTEESHSQSVAWLGVSGAVTFAASWFWALFTSLSLAREARRLEDVSVPPPFPPLT